MPPVVKAEPGRVPAAGAAAFIGSHVVDRAFEAENTVTVSVRRTPGNSAATAENLIRTRDFQGFSPLGLGLAVGNPKPSTGGIDAVFHGFSPGGRSRYPRVLGNVPAGRADRKPEARGREVLFSFPGVV
ncbi:hypothetical protein [Streptosporangium sp. NPDC000396]|uniref:hypothetical protein n=1 Tax=Streptosporangium sp. NPDC000396 TaxID=3366185 RepID=UPI0036CB28FB